jgi:hypothetical protein
LAQKSDSYEEDDLVLVYTTRAEYYYKTHKYKGKFVFLVWSRIFCFFNAEAAEDINEAVKHGLVLSNHIHLFFMLK